MLIEWNKLVFRQRDNKLSHVYLMFVVDWNRQTDQPTGRVSYKGAVSLNRLNDHTSTTLVLRKGSKLPGTNAYLQADNYGIQFKDLYKHLNHCNLRSPTATGAVANGHSAVRQRPA